jgi:uncharacterized protein (UPF0335 family)
MTQQSAIAKAHLRALVERIERLEEERTVLGADIREVYAEAKGQGFDVKTLRKVVRLRKQDRHERQEEAQLLDLYLHALDMLQEDEAQSDQHEVTAGAEQHEAAG